MVASDLIVGYSPEVIRDRGTLAATRIGALVEWTRILAYITGSVDQELLLRMNIFLRKIGSSGRR